MDLLSDWMHPAPKALTKAPDEEMEGSLTTTSPAPAVQPEAGEDWGFAYNRNSPVILSQPPIS